MGARAWHTLRLRGGRREPPQPARGPIAPTLPMTGASAGAERARLIRQTVVEAMRKKRRHLLRQLRPEPAAFTPGDSLVQLLLTAPEAGLLSIALAPLPFEQRHWLSPFPKGAVPVASDPAAPSRAFAKLVEAELRLGQGIAAGETCVDLGGAPGGWTYVAANRGARVMVVDRSPLRSDLMRHPRVEFHAGDAFDFKPVRAADWLLCDVIAPPDQTAGLLLKWLRQGWCRRFVVTLKLRDADAGQALGLLKRELPRLAREFRLTRLCANKKEVCAFGQAAERGPV
jgi:23S rRNA (cytidine2498-2'-O)-methyltransferase